MLILFHKPYGVLCQFTAEVAGQRTLVRRMTAAIGHPTLRLLRVGIGGLPLGGLRAGEWRALAEGERRLLFAGV